MEQDSIKYLPPEIITNILSRLDVRFIASSKCVSKPWLDLLSTDEFVKLHLSRSAAALAVWSIEKYLRVFELEYEIDVKSSHDDRYNHPINLNFPVKVAIEGSANGLLFLYPCYVNDKAAVYVCNPITREYIELRSPRRLWIFGFGASKISGQLKVVRFHMESKFACHVYTLGTGLWRCVEAPSSFFSYPTSASGAFVNGNLHWLVHDSNCVRISCFDLETECFSTFSAPPFKETRLSVLRDCLCVCERPSQNADIALWLMKDYGDDKSWTKEYVINLSPPDLNGCSSAYPIYVFEDGDVLMIRGLGVLFYYSNKTKTTQGIGVFDKGDKDLVTSMLLTPGFLSLKSFPMENVISL